MNKFRGSREMNMPGSTRSGSNINNNTDSDENLFDKLEREFYSEESGPKSRREQAMTQREQRNEEFYDDDIVEPYDSPDESYLKRTEENIDGGSLSDEDNNDNTPPEELFIKKFRRNTSEGEEDLSGSSSEDRSNKVKSGGNSNIDPKLEQSIIAALPPGYNGELPEHLKQKLSMPVPQKINTQPGLNNLYNALGQYNNMGINSSSTLGSAMMNQNIPGLSQGVAPLQSLQYQGLPSLQSSQYQGLPPLQLSQPQLSQPAIMQYPVSQMPMAQMPMAQMTDTNQMQPYMQMPQYNLQQFGGAANNNNKKYKFKQDNKNNFFFERRSR